MHLLLVLIRSLASCNNCKSIHPHTFHMWSFSIYSLLLRLQGKTAHIKYKNLRIIETFVKTGQMVKYGTCQDPYLKIRHRKFKVSESVTERNTLKHKTFFNLLITKILTVLRLDQNFARSQFSTICHRNFILHPAFVLVRLFLRC